MWNKLMSHLLFSGGSRFLQLHLWLLGNELSAVLLSVFTAIPTPHPTMKGYLDNQSVNSSRCCLLVGARKDFMSPWLAEHLSPQWRRPMGTRKSGVAIDMVKNQSCVMMQQGFAWGGEREPTGCICVWVLPFTACDTAGAHCLKSEIHYSRYKVSLWQ